MSLYPIVTALSLPALTILPSPTCIQWSDDGQLVLLTTNATPEHGVNVQRSAIIRQELDNSRASTDYKPTGWLRTMIEWDKSIVVHQWAADCGEWGTVTLGSQDLKFVAITCSPSNSTERLRCVYAILNSNAEVFLYKATKQHFIGKWIMTHSMINTMRVVAEQQKFDAPFQKTLYMQITCLSWSPQVDFGILPAVSLDGSLLAIGNRAGHVCLFRYRPNTGSEDAVEFAASIDVADRWVTCLAWTRWASSQPGQCSAYLACGIADGSIVVSTITQSLTFDNIDSFAAEQKITLSHELSDVQPNEIDRRRISSLTWVYVGGGGSILVFTKPGSVHFWSPSESGVHWTGLRTLILKTQKLSVGSSALSPVSGVTYIPSQDTLVISLADGSFHVVAHLSTNPSLALEPVDSGLSSGMISATARGTFIKVEEERMKRLDVNAIHGMASYDQASFFLWIHEALRPTDFNYKHDAKHTSVFVTAQLWTGNSDECNNDTSADLQICSDGRGTNSNFEAGVSSPPKFGSSDTTTSTCPGSAAKSIHNRRFNVIASISVGWRANTPSAATVQKQFEDPTVRLGFFPLTATTSFVGDILNTETMSRSCCARHFSSEPDTYGFVIVATTPTNFDTTHRRSQDVPFVFRVVVQALLPGTPADVAEEAQSLSKLVQSAVPPDFDVTTNTLGLDELCPACHAKVALHDITTATCPNGHVWARCSITSFILSTPMVRTCIGCGRKALLPPQSESPRRNVLPPAARSWLVEELLDAVQKCFFCGNSFVTLV
ncbi:hypothetical protein NM688_g2748 [Phlebia brevispora]|uniref:Uncharacterized protein n=1 Tax=Phlebia brevispora TaxID=194682 RepID=A0ACC1T7Y1_9APHY|nr:hypothetical protein NM688_g2748 [Phlebia brevispora]